MGFGIHRRQPDRPDKGFHVNCAGWSWLYGHATARGWEPSGTEPPTDWDDGRNKPWSGGYGTNDTQLVTAADASRWANALESGKPYAEESERWREMVDEFIDYCRGGAFEIW